MHIVVSIIFGLVLAGSVSAKESIQGHYDVVGNVPAAHSIKKVVYEEFMNFGCTHCNNLHKASRYFRKIFADKVEFIDIPIIFRGQDDSPLRLYYVARKIGKADLIKDELFKASFTHGVNVFDPGIINYLARSLGIHKEFQKEKDQKKGEPKLIESCTYPLTGAGVVDRIYTDLAVIDITPAGFQVFELSPGVDFDYVQERTGAKLLDRSTPSGS